MPNSLVIEGHTDALPFRKSTPSSGMATGIWRPTGPILRGGCCTFTVFGPTKWSKCAGFADCRLLFPGNPNDPRNRRVSLVVKFASPSG